MGACIRSAASRYALVAGDGDDGVACVEVPEVDGAPGPPIMPLLIIMPPPLPAAIRPCIIWCIVPMHVCMFCIIDRH